MRVLLFFCFLYSVVSDEYYNKRYDYFDVEALAQNPRLLKKYMECFLGKGPCTPVGHVFKRVLPELVATACAKCSPTQRSFAKRTFEAFTKELPQDLTELKKKIDPSPAHKNYENFMRKIADA